MDIMQLLRETTNYLKALIQLTRITAYSQFLFVLIPSFSLVNTNTALSLSAIIMMTIPFFFLLAAGFTYNQMCDAQSDPPEKNPIAKGDISQRKATVLTLTFLGIAVSFFLISYTSVITFVVYSFLILLWFSYSGLGLRLKETVLGVFVASFGFYVAAPLIIFLRFSYFSNSVLCLLLFLFLTSASREIHHTMLDFKGDAAANCRTFAVRIGWKRAIVIKYVLYSLGYSFILLNSILSGNLILLSASILYGVCYFALVAVEVILRHSLKSLWTAGLWIRFLNKLYLLGFSLIYLSLSPVYLLLIVWAFTDVQSF
jgi:4-hydroxybenzoate polyprenyltransferase